jgi:hypothetical protein
MAGRSFVAHPDRQKSLVLGYLRFPEITEIFQNIARDVSLSNNVLSEWDRETLDGHIRQFIIPLLRDAGVIAESSSKQCGYSTEYDEISFQGLTDSQSAKVSAKRAELISNTFEDSDTRGEVLSANIHFHALPNHAREELLGGIRKLLAQYLTVIPDTSSEGRQFRLAIVARAEKAR